MKKILLFSSLFLFAILSACGGGSSGTGSSDSQVVKGVLRDENGQPIVNARIEVLGQDLIVTTNENGEFSFISSEVPNDLILEVDNEDQVAIQPDSDGEVEVEVVITDQGICGVTVDGEEVRNTCDEKEKFCSATETVCSENEYCDFNDGSCGQGSGVCRPFAEVCPELYSPVCGCDNKIYGNACEAQGAGVSVAYLGEC